MASPKEIKIGKCILGPGHPAFIIAELSANHGQSLEIALKTVAAAAEVGADAIKLQTYTADTITLSSDKPWFRIEQGTLWDGRNLYDLYKEAYTPWEWHEELFNEARKFGLEIFSSPFDFSAVDFLAKLHPPAWKVASFEITDIPLVQYMAKQGGPIIISTGIAIEEDIRLAVETCRKAGNENIILLQCTSSYPAPLEDANLLRIPDMANRFDVMTGLSDHTIGSTVPVVAVSLGARVIEKHFILDHSIGGPDAEFSMDPSEFKAMVNAVRDAETTLGKVNYELNPKIQKNRKFARSLFVSADIKKGEVFTKENIRSVRPSDGLPPKYYDQVLGKIATKDLEFGTPLSAEMIEGFEK